jgi:mRNA interferase MazF
MFTLSSSRPQGESVSPAPDVAAPPASSTSQEPRAGFPITLESRAVGLKKRTWIKVSQIRTLAVDRIGARLARASEEELARVLDGLNEILG